MSSLVPQYATSVLFSVAIVVFVAHVCGCSKVQPDPVTQQPAARVHERPVRATAQHPEEPGTTAPTAESFASPIDLPDTLSLDLARNVALEKSPDVRAAIARLEGAVARLGEARAAYFPTVALVSSSSRQFLVPASSNRFLNPFVPQSPALSSSSTGADLATEIILNTIQTLPIFGNAPEASGSSRSFSQHATNFAITWTVFDGFIRDARVASAQHSQKSADFAARDVRRLLIQAVDTAYHQAQLGLEQIRIAEADRTFNQEQLETARRRMEAGKVREDEVESLEVRVMSAEDDVTIAKGVYEMSLTLLAELMALPGAKFPPDVELADLEPESADILAEQDAEYWIALANDQRADLSALAEQVRAADANVKVTKGQFLPALNLTGTWGYDRISNFHYEDEDQSSALALELNYPLYTGGLRTSQVQRAVAERSEAQAKLDRRKLAVAAEVRSVITDLKNAQERLGLQSKTVKTADSARKKAARQYEFGKIALSELNDAQRAYLVADASLTQARVNLRQAWSNLRAAAQAQEGP